MFVAVLTGVVSCVDGAAAKERLTIKVPYSITVVAFGLLGSVIVVSLSHNGLTFSVTDE